MFHREAVAGAAQTHLNLVRDQQDLVLAANLGDLLQVTVRGHDDAAFTLDRLEQEADRVRCDRLLQRLHVAERHHSETWCERPEVPLVSFLAGHAYNRDGAAMEVVAAYDYL